MSTPRRLVATIAALVLGGCALTSKGETLHPRFYSPEPVLVARPAAATEPASPLRFGTVRGAQSIREKVVYRESTYEVAFYDERRWTEKPDVYLRRALAHALYEGGGFVQTMSPDAPSLEVELFAFEEVRGPSPFVRVGITIVLRTEDVALVEKTLVVDQPFDPKATPEPMPAVVQAFSLALGRIVARTIEETSRGTTKLAGAR